MRMTSRNCNIEINFPEIASSNFINDGKCTSYKLSLLNVKKYYSRAIYDIELSLHFV